MQFNRRNFLKSLSRTALVLPLEGVLQMAWPVRLRAQNVPAQAGAAKDAAKPDLGIKDPYELDQKQFDAAVALLKQQRQIVQKYWSDATQQTQDFTSEGVVAAPSWPYQVNLLESQVAAFARTERPFFRPVLKKCILEPTTVISSRQMRQTASRRRCSGGPRLNRESQLSSSCCQ